MSRTCKGCGCSLPSEYADCSGDNRHKNIEKPAEDEFEPTEHDRDPSNVNLRAGYLMGMATKLPPGDDRTFLMRASRSLRVYGEALVESRERFERAKTMLKSVQEIDDMAFVQAAIAQALAALEEDVERAR